ncbi:isoprenylcysteine carboxylmethyltransferase family protein [Pseudovibrio exalbescens]|uniref:isoprenylcysteine carboxyl methyltransferase family protein n=1 Tax=Pseudovibrio exalbescens TaxID=197461 RepID=UPI0023664686|nr:isoprenylcysteine carboxylmethyltransferase family protein [Pseudovibrio exalbescens]MDD7912163.1 isoprenylcysteine carboxylmethyltransferase family protein [Pseudovibrio exalbescens]
MSWPAVAFLVLVGVQRLCELVYANANTKRLLKNGAREVAPSHYKIIVALHASWLLSLALFGWSASLHWLWLSVFVALQLMRIWTLASLKERWTTRIIVTDAPLITSGPYRYLKHPNYLIVAFEIPVGALVLGLTEVAVIFGLLNLGVLYWRIRQEDAALRKQAL